MTIGDRLEKWAWWLDRRPALIVALLAATYVVLVAPSVHRHLWFDELHTFYIAQAPSVRRFIDEIRLLDLNPPLSYLLVRASMDLLGPTELGARLPSIVGYFLASLSMFVFMARRVGALWAAAGVGLFWYNQFFYFATEARPYGLLLGFLGLTLVSWDCVAKVSTKITARRWALTGVAAGTTGMLLTHAYACFWIMPFWAAELVRSKRRGRIDFPLWASLVFPLAAILTYIPLLHNIGKAVFPPTFQGSAARAIWFYLKVFFQVSPALLAGSLAAFALAVWRRPPPAEESSSRAAGTIDLQAHELTFLMGSLLPPILLDAVSMFKHIPFYDRHVILTVLTMNLLFLLFIAYETGANRLSGMAAAIVVLGFTLFLPDLALSLHEPRAESSEILIQRNFDNVHPELPLVANSALTYLEMDHYEKPALLGRLYYLVDVESSIQYSQSNLTEGLLVMKQYFPIRANVSSYSSFTASNRHFLVWGVMDQQGWLLRKLKTEGAQITQIGRFDTPYSDSQLSEVILNP